MTKTTRAELLKFAKPIVLKTWQIQALMDNRLTAARTPIKRGEANPEPSGYGFWKELNERDGLWYIKDYNHGCVWWSENEYLKRFAKHKAGDILFVKETWYYESHMYEKSEGEALYRYVYKADDAQYPVNVGVGEHGRKPSVHMPKEATRYFLRVTGVRVERLWDITDEQAVKEGCYEDYQSATSRQVFMWKWQKTFDKRITPWISNPWTIVTTFERVIPE